MTVEWEEPPRNGGQRGALTDFVEELIKHPGKWGKYPEPIKYAATLSYHKTKYPDVELITKTVDKQLYVWGRYTPKRK